MSKSHRTKGSYKTRPAVQPLPMPSPAVPTAPPATEVSTSSAWVYMPDDESDSAVCDSLEYVLIPNIATPIKSRSPKMSDLAVAKHIVAKLAQWGACLVSGPVTDGKATNPEDQPLVDASERVYLVATRAWAETLLIDRHKRNSPRIAVGLPEDKVAKDEQTARDWLAAKADKLAAL